MTFLVELVLLSAVDRDAAIWLGSLADRGPEVADAAQQVLRRHDDTDDRYEVVTAPTLVTGPDGLASLEVGRLVPLPAASWVGDRGQTVVSVEQHRDGLEVDLQAAADGVRVALDVHALDVDTGEITDVDWAGALAPSGDWVVMQPSGQLILLVRATPVEVDAAQIPARARPGDALLAPFDLDSRRDRRNALRSLLPGVAR